MAADALNRIYEYNSVKPVNHVIKVSDQSSRHSQSFSELLEQEQAKLHTVKRKRKENPPVHLLVSVNQYNNQAKRVEYLFSSTTDYKA